MVKGKKGWVKMVEAFISITLIMSFLIVLVSNDSQEEKLNEDIYSIQANILNKIEKNNSLRDIIIDVGSLPISLDDENFPSEIRDEINSEKPFYLSCDAKICEIDGECLFEENVNINVYSRSLGIFADDSEYNPRQLRLFCWANNL